MINFKNSIQVARHLSGLIKTSSQLEYAVQIISKIRHEAIGRFDNLIEIDSYGRISVPYFEEHAETKRDHFGLSIPLEEQIAFAMRDYGAPFSAYEVRAFCSFFELDTKAMLEEAATDEQYDEWVSYERRNAY